MTSLWKRLIRPATGSDVPVEESPERPIDKADRLISGGHMLEDYSEFEAALEQYRQSVAAAPSYARAYMNVGNALDKLARVAEAIVAYQQAVSCNPAYAPARFNLGSLHLRINELTDAEREIREALRLQPDMFQAAIVLADILEAQERFEEAEAAFLRAREIVPEHAGAMLNYGLFCFRQDRFDEAMSLFERAKAVDPGFTDAESSILFSLNFRTDCDAETVAREHRRVGGLISDAAGPAFDHWPNTPDRNRRLRVGYVSGDFLNHPVALFLRPVLENRNSDAFETFCYSNHSYPNPVADALREKADQWRNISELDDKQVAEQIRRDEIDILVDLSGHTRRGRLSVFARHTGPVQVTWLGYLNTTGLPSMDYRISDPHTDPEGETEYLHTEQLVRMPHSQWCYGPWYHAEPVSDPHVDRPAALIFGSFNQYRKISDPCLAAWCTILEQLPHAELLVLDVKQPPLQKQLLDRVEANGIDPSRVTVRGREIILQYFSTIGNVDIALDTFPYNGATTTLDTLWMGVPIVGLQGNRGISRGTYSILRSLGEDDLIARDIDAYIDLNVRLAHDKEWRIRLRDTLRMRLVASPLMDAVQFTEALEQRYRTMWHSWCSHAGRSRH